MSFEMKNNERPAASADTVKGFDPDKRVETPSLPQQEVKGGFDPDKRIDVGNAQEALTTERYDPDKRIGEAEINGTKEPNEPKEVEHFKCRNEELKNKIHPDTKVPFVEKIVEVASKLLEVVVPEFKSFFDTKLPESMYKETDAKQFKVCNQNLKEAVEKDDKLRSKFSDEQLEQIKNGDTPDGYVWHHDLEPGKMQLVDYETHQRTGHTGGRSIWGGGTINR